MKPTYAVVLASLCWAASAWADKYPTRPVTEIVPFAAGAPTDTRARVVGVCL